MRLSEHITVIFICGAQGVSPYTFDSTTLSKNHRHGQMRVDQSRSRPRRHTIPILNVAPQGFGDFEPLKILEHDDDEEDLENCSKKNVEERIVQFIDFCGSKPIPYQTMWVMQKELVEGHIGRLAKEPKNRTPESQFVSNIEPFSLDSDANKQGNDVREGHDSIIFLQHEPVYTLGTGSDESFIKGYGTKNNIDNGEKEVDIVRIERGGEVTYHGPGQLVAYPILDLRGYRTDLHWYMRALEEAIIIALTNVGIKGATREDDVTGVWVNNKKIGAMGIKVKRWVTMHGLSVNVDHRSLKNFNGIVPCGLVGREVCCINDFLEEPITVEDFALHLKAALQVVLEVKLVPKN